MKFFSINKTEANIRQKPLFLQLFCLTFVLHLSYICSVGAIHLQNYCILYGFIDFLPHHGFSYDNI